jgi:hypothetical protein
LTSETNIQKSFKYVGEEKYIEVFDTQGRKCNECGLTVPKEEKLTKVCVTFFEVSEAGQNKIKFFGSLHGHKILDLNLEEPCRWQWA